MFKNGMRPVHPGECLREDYLMPLQMSVDALAQALGLPLTRVEDIVSERCGLTADTVTRLAHYFDTTPQYWMALQAEYDLRVAEIEDEVRWDSAFAHSQDALAMLAAEAIAESCCPRRNKGSGVGMNKISAAISARKRFS